MWELVSVQDTRLRESLITLGANKLFLPVWESLCLFRVPDWEKTLPHRGHANFFSPVWESLCVLRLSDLEIVLPHWSQVNCFAPVWTSLCFFRQLDLKKFLSHWKQENRLLVIWWVVGLSELSPKVSNRSSSVCDIWLSSVEICLSLCW